MGADAEERRIYLQELIALAERAESLIKLDRAAKPLEMLVFEFLVFSKRLSSAIEMLCPALAFEAGILERCIIEAWINLEWIRLKDTENRASRFMKFAPVEMVSFLEQLPTYWRNAQYSDRLRAWKEVREPYRPLFERQTKSGKRRWDRDWAEPASVKDRLIQIAETRLARKGQTPESAAAEIDAAGNTGYYAYYRHISQRTHVAQLGLEPLLEWIEEHLRVVGQPHVDPANPMEVAAGALLDIMTFAVTTLRLPMQDEITAATKRGRELRRLLSQKGGGA